MLSFHDYHDHIMITVINCYFVEEKTHVHLFLVY